MRERRFRPALVPSRLRAGARRGRPARLARRPPRPRSRRGHRRRGQRQVAAPRLADRPRHPARHRRRTPGPRLRSAARPDRDHGRLDARRTAVGRRPLPGRPADRARRGRAPHRHRAARSALRRPARTARRTRAVPGLVGARASDCRGPLRYAVGAGAHRRALRPHGPGRAPVDRRGPPRVLGRGPPRGPGRVRGAGSGTRGTVRPGRSRLGVRRRPLERDHRLRTLRGGPRRTARRLAAGRRLPDPRAAGRGTGPGPPGRPR